MKKVNIDIKNVVLKNLNETRELKLINSYYKIKDKKGQELVESFMNTSIKLMNDGYTLDEINLILFEQANTENISNALKNVDWIGGLTSTLKSSLKEMVIYSILTALGFKKDNAMLISSFMKDMTPLDLLRPFKDKSHCIQYGPKVIDALLEAIARWGGRKITGSPTEHESWKDIFSMIVGNTVGTIIEKSDTSETIAKKLCPIIHD